MAMLNLIQITKLPGFAGFTWKQILFLAAAGIAAGLVLALTTSLPVS
jgi:hypothetical protein